MDEAGWDRVLRQSGLSGIDGFVRINPEDLTVGSILLATALPNSHRHIRKHPSYLWRSSSANFL